MFKVITDHPVAVNSDDHKHPEGIYYDNNYSHEFVFSLEEYFKEYYGKTNLKVMDLGCAGGELVVRLNDHKHVAVGLEGSDHCLVIRPEMVAEVGFMPRGYKNWEQFGNKNLFTCDVTKPFQVTSDDKPFKFDVITCWDVIEHFYDDELDQFFDNVNLHLEDTDSMFISSIDMTSAPRNENSKNTPHNIDYHKSIHTREWWENKLSEHFNVLDAYPFICSNRKVPPHHPSLFACVKK